MKKRYKTGKKSGCTNKGQSYAKETDAALCYLGKVLRAVQ